MRWCAEMDYIYLKGMSFFAYHGAFAEEKKLGQRFILDLSLGLNLQQAGETDDLTKTVHYGEVYELVKSIMSEKSYDLIEAVAEKIAQEILADFPLVQEVNILLKKPEVPIPGILDYAAIEIKRKRGQKAYLGLGTNMGDKEEQIKQAVAYLADEPGIKVLRRANLYATAPVGYTDQDWFLNTAVEIETTLSPEELLKAVNRIELKQSRVRLIRWGPRTLDIDILLYGAERVALPHLEIPHIRLAERAFVLYPLAELIPDYVHPISGRTVQELKDSLGEEQEIKIYQEKR